ncbi:MAG TPA: outer membrane beta-barrel protein [Gemmatimonadaceae bacterium]
MRFSFLALALATTLSVPAAAQGNPQTRQGFFISFGFGAGSLGCDDCDDDRLNGVNFYLRMGGTLSQRLLIGGVVNGWSKTENDATLTVSNVGPVIVFYPSAQGGFFLKGGLGLSNTSLDLGAFEIEEEGVGLTIGIGYDARVGRNFALTPYLDILTSSYDGGSFNQVAFGLGFTWP